MRRFQTCREFVQTGWDRLQRLQTGRFWRAALQGLVCSALLGLACVPDVARRGQAGRGQGGAPESPPLDLTGDSPWPAPYGSDPLWRRASTGSDFDHARLAQRESAAALLAALARGGSLGRTALAALPYASDRREVVGPLCELVLGPVPPTSSWLLGSLYEALSNAPRSEESVDPRADVTCANQLRQLAERERSSPEDRDRALAAISLLAER
jgi:hypothetical protein